MKLSTRGRYAVTAMVDLATSNQDQPKALGDIAASQDISLSYLEQLFAKMRRVGLVKSVRGPGGGYRLGCKPSEIRISDIMIAAEESVDFARAAGKTVVSLESQRRCATDDLWEELGRSIHLFLNSVTLEDVLERRVLGLTSYPMERVAAE